ncbi:hypothetical protein H5410_027158 [Solanum commersonii]|uniref:Uncharacterized protein n=1 Tax=Solanum commersonii TaxID=4109 RepID=A0A9J5YZ31_SOLCO|nr:hypothetical protein H5410_027158 [Solanum commersonii]
MHPILALDWEFFEEKSGTIGLIENGFSNMIDNILLQHVGSLFKYFLDLSTIDCNDRDLDHWLLCVTTLVPNLLELTSKFIKFCPDKVNYVLDTPLLYSLIFIACNAVHFLTISAPRIQFLTVHDSHDIHASFFDNLSNVKELFMVLNVYEESKSYEQERFITWSRLFYLCSNLARLVFE